MKVETSPNINNEVLYTKAVYSDNNTDSRSSD
jgi:ADP-ribose pyrophosphatase YjhB (NUDIX family)